MNQTMKYIGGAIVAGTAITLALHAAGVFTTVATAPGRIVNRTMSTVNIIQNYEWFYDANGQINARVGQIAAHAKLIAAETDKRERAQLNIELAGMQQSCRELVEKYNANSEKANHSIFKSNNLPDSFNPSICGA